MVVFLLEREIERELNLPCAGEGLQQACKCHGVHAKEKIDLCHIGKVEKIEKLNALIRAIKTFDLLVIPGESHDTGRSSEVRE